MASTSPHFRPTHTHHNAVGHFVTCIILYEKNPLDHASSGGMPCVLVFKPGSTATTHGNYVCTLFSCENKIRFHMNNPPRTSRLLRTGDPYPPV